MKLAFDTSLFEEVFGLSSELTALLDPTGRVLALNTAVRKLGGHDTDVPVEMEFWRMPWMVHSPSEQGRMQQALDQCKAGRPVEFETSLQGSDEKFRFVEISLTPLRGNSGAVERILLRGRDVTDFHRLREALAFRSEFEAYISEVSATFINLPGSEIDRHVEQHLRDVCLYTVTSVAYIFRYSEDGSQVSLTHLWKDDDVVLPPKETLQKMDVALTPWRTSKILSGQFCLVKSIDELPAEAAHEAAAMRQMGMISQLDVPLIYQDQVIGFMGIAGRQLLPEWDDDIVALMSIIGQVFTNAIIRKEGAEEQGVLETQLRQSQKMEAIGLLAGGIAHDFNNFLQAIQGYSDLILATNACEEPVREDVQQIKEVTQKAAGLTRQLLAFSRRQVISPEVLDLEEIVGAMVKMLRRLLGEHVELVVKADGSVRPVYMDRNQVEQVLLNLCVNARDAIVDGGTISIELSSAQFDAAFCRAHPWAAEGHYTSIFVRDDGCGISQDSQARVFEPFFSTKEKGKGTGLGLSTVYGIVSQAKGLIDLESQVGHGSVFKIYLPVVLSEGEQTVNSEEKVIGGVEHILLAEDSDSVRRAARRILEGAGYTVYAAADGEASFELFKHNQRQIELALLDVVMPKLGGFELRQKMKELKPELKVLMVSGYNDESVDSDLLSEQGIHLLNKPFGRDELLREVRRILDSEPS